MYNGGIILYTCVWSVYCGILYHYSCIYPSIFVYTRAYFLIHVYTRELLYMLVYTWCKPVYILCIPVCTCVNPRIGVYTLFLFFFCFVLFCFVFILSCFLFVWFYKKNFFCFFLCFVSLLLHCHCTTGTLLPYITLVLYCIDPKIARLPGLRGTYIHLLVCTFINQCIGTSTFEIVKCKSLQMVQGLVNELFMTLQKHQH